MHFPGKSKIPQKKLNYKNISFVYRYHSVISDDLTDPLDKHIIRPEETKPIYKDDLLSKRKIKGYIQRNIDNLFKIQGTSYLLHRSCYQPNYVRECFFVCLYTALLAINQPLNTWNYRKIDVAVENGIELFSKADTLMNMNERYIEKILVNDKFYNIFVKKLIPRELNLISNLYKFMENFKYLLLQFSNMTFLVYKFSLNEFNFYNLFDSYKTLEICENKNLLNEKEEKIEKNDFKIFSDENTASWILFPDFELLGKYIESRVTSEDFKENYLFYSIHITSFENANITYDSEELSAYTFFDDDENIYEIPHEKIKWLDSKKIVPWSRNERFNTLKQVHNFV